MVCGCSERPYTVDFAPEIRGKMIVREILRGLSVLPGWLKQCVNSRPQGTGIASARDDCLQPERCELRLEQPALNVKLLSPSFVLLGSAQAPVLTFQFASVAFGVATLTVEIAN